MSISNERNPSLRRWSFDPQENEARIRKEGLSTRECSVKIASSKIGSKEPQNRQKNLYGTLPSSRPPFVPQWKRLGLEHNSLGLEYNEKMQSLNDERKKMISEEAFCRGECMAGERKSREALVVPTIVLLADFLSKRESDNENKQRINLEEMFHRGTYRLEEEASREALAFEETVLGETSFRNGIHEDESSGLREIAPHRPITYLRVAKKGMPNSGSSESDEKEECLNSAV